MKLKILSLVMRIPEAEFFTKVARYLNAYDIEMEFVAGHESACDVFKKEGVRYYNIYEKVKKPKNNSDANARVLKFKVDLKLKTSRTFTYEKSCISGVSMNIKC